MYSLRYTRLSPLFEEMSLAADSDERKLYRRLLDTSLFYCLHGGKRSLRSLGKWWTEFRNGEFWFRSVIAFSISLSQFRERKNGRESLQLIFKKSLKTWNPNFRLEFSKKENRRMPFQTLCLFQEFSTETSKTTRKWVNGKPGKAPKCPLSLS